MTTVCRYNGKEHQIETKEIGHAEKSARERLFTALRFAFDNLSIDIKVSLYSADILENTIPGKIESLPCINVQSNQNETGTFHLIYYAGTLLQCSDIEARRRSSDGVE